MRFPALCTDNSNFRTFIPFLGSLTDTSWLQTLSAIWNLSIEKILPPYSQLSDKSSLFSTSWSLSKSSVIDFGTLTKMLIFFPAPLQATQGSSRDVDNIFTRNPIRIEAYIKSNVHIDQGESPSQASDNRKQLLGRLSLTESRRAFNGTGERRVIRTQKWVGTIR